MSLLIKALKEAEARHREATAEAIALTASDPTVEHFAATAVQAPAAVPAAAPGGMPSLTLSLDDAPRLEAEQTLSLSLDEPPQGSAQAMPSLSPPSEASEPATLPVTDARAGGPSDADQVSAAVPQAHAAPRSAPAPASTTPTARRAPAETSARAAVEAERAGPGGAQPPSDPPVFGPSRPAGAGRFGSPRVKLYGGLGLLAVAAGAWIGWQAFAPIGPVAAPTQYPADAPGGIPATGLPAQPGAAPPPVAAIPAEAATSPAPAATGAATQPATSASRAGPARASAAAPRALVERRAARPAMPAEAMPPDPRVDDAPSRPAVARPDATAASTAVRPVPDTTARAPAGATAVSAGPPVPVAASVAPAPRGGVRLQRDTSGERIGLLIETGYAALARHDDKTARKVYEEAVALDPNNGDGWVGLGTIAARAGDPVRAERHFQRALEIDPNDAAARAGLLALRGAADVVSQESALRNLIAEDESQPSHHFALGNALAAQGRWLDAQQAYFAAWSLDSGHPDYAFNLAVSLERIRQPRAALDYYEKATRLAGSRPARFDPKAVQARIAALQGAGAR